MFISPGITEIFIEKFTGSRAVSVILSVNAQVLMRLMSVLLLNSHIQILNPPTCSHHIQPPETMLDIQVSLLLFIGNGMINDMGQGDFTLTHIHLATHSLGMERHSLECSESLLINTSQALSDIPPFAQRSVLLQS